MLVGLVFRVPVAHAAATTEASVESSIARLINRDRAALGLPAYGVNSTLASIAGTRSAALAAAQVLDHAVAGDLPSQLNAAGVAWQGWGENLAKTPTAWGPDVGPALYAQWKGSPPHWAMIISRDFNQIGVGVTLAASGATYASIVFIDSPNGSGVVAQPNPTPRPAPATTPRPATPAPEPTPEPSIDAQLWVGDPSDSRPEGSADAASPLELIEWLATVLEGVVEVIGSALGSIAAVAGRLAWSG
ncbi:MAG: CAP domain-containing protein [Chloroflexota bacterium]